MMPRRSPKPIRNKRIVKVEKATPSSRVSTIDWGRVRLWAVAIFFSLTWCALWARAYHLQIIMGPEFAEKAKRQYTTMEVLRGMRGNIVDRNGNILAQSIDCQSVWVNPSLVINHRATADELGKILGTSPVKILPLLQSEKKFAWIKRKISDKAARQIKESGLPGVFLAAEFDRLYPYQHLGGQLIGFVDVDDKGLEGIEKFFEAQLTGQRIKQEVQRDAVGGRMAMNNAEEVANLRGKNIRLTIDTHVQFFAEQALAENVEKFAAKWGGCIVVDVPTGEILAWAQYPFFNPNAYQDYPPAVRRNRLAMDALEQGSTIKSFLIAAALEEKVVTPSTVINCEKGKWVLKTATIHDTHPYSTLPVDKVLHVSSNIGAAKIGMKLGASKYHAYLTRLGFGSRPELPLAGEARGILRPASQWHDIDLAASSFGQSFSATLSQMAEAYLTLAGNGTKKELKLVALEELPDIQNLQGLQGVQVNGQPALEAGSAAPSDESDDPHNTFQPITTTSEAKEILFSPSTMKLVRSMLREVVEEEGGTGMQAHIPGISVGGKTGTAQKADRSGKYGTGRVASFVGMVPIDNPRYLICILLDEPSKNQYGGVVAAPVFRNVALRTMGYHGMLPDNPEASTKTAEKETGKKGKKSKEKAIPATPVEKLVAGKNATQRNIAAKNTDASSSKNATSPAISNESTAQLANTSTLRPSISSAGRKAINPGIVPPVTGMGVRQAVETLAKHGVLPSLKGKGGFVVRQTPEGGAAWSADNRECTLWLEERAI